jgi:hypothetical protein
MFEGFTEKECRVSSTALVHYDRNRYSVQCQYAGKTVSVRAYAERIAMVADGKGVGEHVRSFGRGRTVFDPWHDVPAPPEKARGAEKRRALPRLGSSHSRGRVARETVAQARRRP